MQFHKTTINLETLQQARARLYLMLNRECKSGPGKTRLVRVTIYGSIFQ